MRVASGVEMLDLPTVLPDGPSVIHPTLIWDQDNVILVDAGVSGAPALREAFGKAGVPFERLNRVILTHQDLDHIGGLRSILDSVPGRVEVIAHDIEKPYIQGDQTPTKMAMLQHLLSIVPEQKRDEIRGMFEMMKTAYGRLHVIVDRTVVDGEELPYCGGITVVHTPGHTPGHIALYLKRSQTLVSGDALFCEGGTLVLPPAPYCSDAGQAKQSLRRLAAYDIETVICYHGGVFSDDANRRIAGLGEPSIG